MDNAMVKRGIGAIVLAVVAALLLGLLLKDKSRERQDVVEMKLPGAPEMNIPSLTGSADSDTTTPSLLETAKAKIDGGASGMNSAGSAIIASATGAATDATTVAMDSTSTAIQGMKPGFAIRPSSQNEEKEIVDGTDTPTTTIAPATKEPSKTVEKKNTVVASTSKKAKEAFKPSIVEKKKKITKSTAKTKAKPKKAAPAKKESVAKKETSKKTAPAVSSSALGKYSVQLLATSSQSRANKLASTMKGEGYKVFITQTTRENKILYRVRVGGHANRNGAIKAQDGMKKRYRKNFFVQNSLVVSN